ncbi:MAG: VanZ family protein [Coriobacteriia bacterium]
MILRFGPVGLLILALIVGVACGAVRLISRIPFRRVVVESVFAAYAATLFAVVLLESSHFGTPGEIFSLRLSLNLIPLRTIVEFMHPELSGRAVRQLAGNVVLFVPLGVLLPAMGARFRRMRPLLTTALLVSAGIELTQLALLIGHVAVRSVDVDDVILNTLGAAIGYAIWFVFSHGGHRLAKGVGAAPQDAG